MTSLNITEVTLPRAAFFLQIDLWVIDNLQKLQQILIQEKKLKEKRVLKKAMQETEDYLDQKRRKIKSKFQISNDYNSPEQITKNKMVVKFSPVKNILPRTSLKLPGNITNSPNTKFPSSTTTVGSQVSLNKKGAISKSHDSTDIGGHAKKSVKKRLKGMSIFLFKNEVNYEDNEENFYPDKLEKLEKHHLQGGTVALNTLFNKERLNTRPSRQDLAISKLTVKSSGAPSSSLKKSSKLTLLKKN